MPAGRRSRSSRGRTCAQWNGNGSFNYRSDAMNARNAFANSEDTRAEPQLQPRRARSDRQGQDVDSLRPRRPPRLPGRHHRRHRRVRQSPGRLRAPSVRVHQRHRRSRARAEQQPDAASRVPSRRKYDVENSGVGGFNLPERAFNTHSNNNQLRVAGAGHRRQEHAARGAAAGLYAGERCRRRSRRRRRSSCSTPSRRAAPASRAVARSRTFELAENLDFNIGRKQQMRVGYICSRADATRTSTRETPLGRSPTRRIEAFNENRPDHVYPAPRPGEHLVLAVQRWASTGRTTSG